MSLRGIRQLKELIIRYSDYDGSSRGAIEWMKRDLIAFASDCPSSTITTVIRRNKHPYLRGVYMNGNTKTIDIRNQDPDTIRKFAYFLRNQIGRKVG
jgi:large subunit ribosomal protein L43